MHIEPLSIAHAANLKLHLQERQKNEDAEEMGTPFWYPHTEGCAFAVVDADGETWAIVHIDSAAPVLGPEFIGRNICNVWYRGFIKGRMIEVMRTVKQGMKLFSPIELIGLCRSDWPEAIKQLRIYGGHKIGETSIDGVDYQIWTTDWKNDERSGVLRAS